MNGLMPNTTTVTEIQRSYKRVSKRAKRIKEPLTVLSNNKPDLVVMDYDVFKNWQKKQFGSETKNKGNFKDLFGIWTKQEAEEFNKRIDEMFERVDPEDWK